MDVAVGKVDGRASEGARPLGVMPFVRPADFVDDLRHPLSAPTTRFGSANGQ
jgi:hypothetical protein